MIKPLRGAPFTKYKSKQEKINKQTKNSFISNSMEK